MRQKPHPLLGTEGAGNLFWSTDSRTLGFFADGKLKTINASRAGQPSFLGTLPTIWAGSWRQDGTILFGDYVNGLYKVTAGGGSPVLVIEADGFEDSGVRAPHFLPDGRHFIYFIGSDNPEMTGTWLSSLDGGQGRLLVRGVAADYASGFLLYVRGDVLMAQAIDAASGDLRGDPRPLVDHVLVGPGGALFYGISKPSVVSGRRAGERPATNLV